MEGVDNDDGIVLAAADQAFADLEDVALSCLLWCTLPTKNADLVPANLQEYRIDAHPDPLQLL